MLSQSIEKGLVELVDYKPTAYITETSPAYNHILPPKNYISENKTSKRG